jgi:hypothetical protein
VENYDEQAKERRREEEEAAVSSNYSDDFEQDEPITPRESEREVEIKKNTGATMLAGGTRAPGRAKVSARGARAPAGL